MSDARRRDPKGRSTAGTKRTDTKRRGDQSAPFRPASFVEVQERVTQSVYSEIMMEINAGDVTIYTSINGRPHLHSAVPGLKHINHDLADRDCEEWVMQMARQRFDCILRGTNARRVCKTLAGLQPRPRPDTVTDAGEFSSQTSALFVDLILWFMGKKGVPTYRKRAAECLKEITKEVSTGAPPKRAHAIPRSPAHLSRLISKCAPELLAAGIEVSRKRSDGGWIILKKLPDDNGPMPSESTKTDQSGVQSALPSAAPSAETPEKTRSDAVMDAIRLAKVARTDKRVPDESGTFPEGSFSQ